MPSLVYHKLRYNANCLSAVVKRTVLYHAHQAYASCTGNDRYALFGKQCTKFICCFAVDFGGLVARCAVYADIVYFHSIYLCIFAFAVNVVFPLLHNHLNSIVKSRFINSSTDRPPEPTTILRCGLYCSVNFASPVFVVRRPLFTSMATLRLRCVMI